MRPVEEVQQVSARVFFWQGYDPAVKTDLSCSAVVAAEGLVFIDPIPLAPAALEELAAAAKPCAVVVTSGHHERASAEFGRRFGIPVFASPRETVAGDLEAIPIEGAGPEEIALHLPGESLHLGDAVIHVEPYGFALLPEKYCADALQMRQSLRKLLRREFRLLLLAHGTPVVTDAHARLARLLA